VGIKDAKLVARAATSGLSLEHDDERHLDAAMQWLCLAQDACGGKGSKNLYGLKTGWGIAYPETSGYIMATYLAYAEHSGDAGYVQRAIQIGDWEIEIQTPRGGVLSSEHAPNTRVFNTGQVILGWCALYEQTKDSKYLSAALRAGEYLVNEQESDGTWRRDTHCGARTYHARVDWALLRLASLSGRQQLADVATKNLHWVLRQQRTNGWFDSCGFHNKLPITHVIAYTLRGLLESHLLGTSVDLLPGIVKAADALCTAIPKTPVRGIAGMVPASFDENWGSADDHSCLTGNAQLACVLFLLAHISGSDRYRETAESVVHAMKRTQNIDTPFPAIRGAIAGSYPLSIGYVADGFPNWATKFFADAIMMKLHFAQKKRVLA
jgi:uncharacterized protein YyaL (SSP411 family)